MLSSAPVLIDTPASVRSLLDIREASDFRCHGITQKRLRCKVKVAAANAVTVDTLLSKIAAAATHEEKCQILHRMAPLTLCARWHQGQQTALVSVWENLVKEIDVKVDVKVEDDEESQVRHEADIEEDVLQEEVCTIKHEHKPAKSTKTRVKVEKKVESLVHIPTPAPAKPPYDLATKSRFEPYSSLKSTLATNTFIASMLSTPLTEASLRSTSTSGYVYIYTFPPPPGTPARFLKIGNASKIDARLKQWERQCGHTPTLLCHFETHLYKQVERIIHAQLGNERLREVNGCEGCGKKHKEWFEVKLRKAGMVLGLWTAWSLRKPYDETGFLKKEWRMKLKELDLSDENCWEDFVDG